jgi:hypothetical protein
MTIKEIAELRGTNRTTVLRWAHKIADDPVQNAQGLAVKLAEAEKSGKDPADFTLEETLAIIGEGGRNKALASLLAENAANKNALAVLDGGGMLTPEPMKKMIEAFSMLKRVHGELQNVYRQNEDYRMKYINLLDKLENKGMAIEEIWELSRVNRGFLMEYRQKMVVDKKAYREGGEWGRETAPKQAPGGATRPLEAPREAKGQENTDEGKYE